MTGFSKVVFLEDVPAGGLSLRLDAPPESLAPLARRLGVKAARRLAGEIEVSRHADGLCVAGRLEGVFQRECVASLDLFDEEVADEFEIVFSPDAPVPEGGDETALDEDAPEPLPAEGVDLGEILIQQATLAMAPYPRKPGAQSLAETHGEGARISPFADLARAIAPNRDEG